MRESIADSAPECRVIWNSPKPANEWKKNPFPSWSDVPALWSSGFDRLNNLFCNALRVVHLALHESLSCIANVFHAIFIQAVYVHPLVFFRQVFLIEACVIAPGVDDNHFDAKWF